MAEVLGHFRDVFSQHAMPSSQTQIFLEDADFQKHIRLENFGVPGSPPSACSSPSSSPEDLATKIVEILASYRLVINATKDKVWTRRGRVTSLVLEAISNDTSIEMILPGFPFKSPNKVAKVLGKLPDKAEEMALEHLDGLCAAIEGIYPPGANLHICSDGPMYNDLLGVDDEEVYDYGNALRELALQKGCTHIKFIKLAQLLDDDGSEPWSKEKYLETVPANRQALVDRYTPEGFNIDAFVKKDEATTLRYRGCIKFLEKDLEHAPRLANMSKSQKKKSHGATAKLMIQRGECFAGAVNKRFGGFVRLSVHASGTEGEKLSVSLLPISGAHETTPWHNVLVRELNGSMGMAHRECISGDSYDVVHEQDKASYLRSQSQLYDWPGMDVHFEYLYPCGIIISPAAASVSRPLQFVHLQKVLALAEECSPIILRGFTFPRGYSAPHAKALTKDDEGRRAADVINGLKQKNAPSDDHHGVLSTSVSVQDTAGDNTYTTNTNAYQTSDEITDNHKHSEMQNNANGEAQREVGDGTVADITHSNVHAGIHGALHQNAGNENGESVRDVVENKLTEKKSAEMGEKAGDKVPDETHDTKHDKIEPKTNGALHIKTHDIGHDNNNLNTHDKLHEKSNGKTHGRFQLFTRPAHASKGNFNMLFISSRLLFQHMPQQYTVEELKSLAWVCSKPGCDDEFIERQPLVAKHPRDNDRFCLRLPEFVPVGIAKRTSDAADCRADDCGVDYAALVDTMMNDRRVFKEVELLKGDVVVSDRYSAAHVTADQSTVAWM